MFIVADSGSTKTNWSIVEKDIIINSFKTRGFNPYFVNNKLITRELAIHFPDTINQNHIKNIYFYGAGCSSEQTNQIILKGCKNFFTNAQINIETDLLGAARAIFVNQQGIIAIMGTGSNTGVYNGEEISRQINSLGFALGDEGSGAHLGKLLIIDYLHDNFPKDLKTQFEKEISLRKDEIIYTIYKKPSPSRFLASFTPFIIENKKHPHLNNLIQQSIQELFEKYIFKYPDYQAYPLGFSGSVAYYLKPELNIIAKAKEINISGIVKDPLKKMVEYHIKKKKI